VTLSRVSLFPRLFRVAPVSHFASLPSDVWVSPSPSIRVIREISVFEILEMGRRKHSPFIDHFLSHRRTFPIVPHWWFLLDVSFSRRAFCGDRGGGCQDPKGPTMTYGSLGAPPRLSDWGSQRFPPPPRVHPFRRTPSFPSRTHALYASPFSLDSFVSSPVIFPQLSRNITTVSLLAPP